MTAVTAELATVPDSDIQAIATYIAAQMPRPAGIYDPLPVKSGEDTEAAQIFAGACGSCHAATAPMTRDGAPSLSLSTSVSAPTPAGVIQVILNGIPWREGQTAPYMPAFGAALTDDQVVALTAYLRTHFSDRTAWDNLATQVATARKDGGS